MASISVDIDLDEFDLYEILEEIEYRYNTHSRRKEQNQKEINDFIKRMKIDCEEHIPFKINSINDQMKIDFLIENLDKINLSDLENLIK